MRTLLLIFLCGISACQANTPEHAQTNANRYRSATIPSHRVHAASVVGKRVLKFRARYEAVQKQTNVPWFVIAALHNMEASGDFSKHLHEGSSLKARTRYVPKGRPLTGSPPFTWEYSAQDAMNYDRMGAKDWQRLGMMLNACEGYNGWGYFKYHKSTPTPYLYAATTVERPGKYVADGRWSATARSQQIGVAAIWKCLEAWGAIKLPGS